MGKLKNMVIDLQEQFGIDIDEENLEEIIELINKNVENEDAE